MKTLFIIGSGGHAEVIGTAAKEFGWNPVYILKSGSAKLDNGGIDFIDEEHILSLSDLAPGSGLICGVGSVGLMNQRMNVIKSFSKFSRNFVSVVHSQAIVDRSAVIKSGVFVGMGAIVSNSAIIGENSIVNTGAIIEHNCKIGMNVHIASGAVLAGNVTLEDHVLIGCGSTVIQNVRVGKGVIVGAGAVVVSDIPDDSGTWVGSPAKKVVGRND